MYILLPDPPAYINFPARFVFGSLNKKLSPFPAGMGGDFLNGLRKGPGDHWTVV
jgi:hypothetical protein